MDLLLYILGAGVFFLLLFLVIRAALVSSSRPRLRKRIFVPPSMQETHDTFHVVDDEERR